MPKTKITQKIIKDTYEELEERARCDLDFIFLIMLAAAICTFGFKMNSPSIIIGSMVVSPLLYTVVGTGTSFYFRKFKNLLRNLSALTISILIIILISFIIGQVLPIEKGSEITSRLASGLGDYFFVALLSGLAGTFSIFWPKIIEAVAGIAISVAMIPPMVMIGLGLAQEDYCLMKLSFVIVLVNLLGIFVSSFVTAAGLKFYSKNFSK